MLGPYQLDPTYFGALFHLAHFRPLTWYPPHGINLVDVRDVARTVVDCLESGEGPGRSVLASGDDVPYRQLVEAINRAAGHEVTAKEIPPWVIRRMPNLRFFGTFGKHYFDRPHYVNGSGLPGRRHTFEDLVRDTVAFAARTGRYRSTFGLVTSLARRYL
jgi:nucleoside-diphosphate-sugar epimerase